jgi:hypothetical protein
MPFSGQALRHRQESGDDGGQRGSRQYDCRSRDQVPSPVP